MIKASLGGKTLGLLVKLPRSFGAPEPGRLFLQVRGKLLQGEPPMKTQGTAPAPCLPVGSKE